MMFAIKRAIDGHRIFREKTHNGVSGEIRKKERKKERKKAELDGASFYATGDTRTYVYLVYVYTLSTRSTS